MTDVERADFQLQLARVEEQLAEAKVSEAETNPGALEATLLELDEAKLALVKAELEKEKVEFEKEVARLEQEEAKLNSKLVVCKEEMTTRPSDGVRVLDEQDIARSHGIWKEELTLRGKFNDLRGAREALLGRRRTEKALELRAEITLAELGVISAKYHLEPRIDGINPKGQTSLLGNFDHADHRWIVTEHEGGPQIKMILQESLLDGARPLAQSLEMLFGSENRHHFVAGVSGAGKTSAGTDLAKNYYLIYLQCEGVSPRDRRAHDFKD